MSETRGEALRSGAEELRERWKEYQVVTEWGYEGFLRCPRCYAFTDDPGKHENWHAETER